MGLQNRNIVRRRRDRGGSVLEFGLIYGLFLFLLIATLDFGQVLFTHQTYAERVREAARYGAVRPWNSTTKREIEDIVLFGKPGGTGDAGWFGLNRSNVDVFVTPQAAPGLPSQLTVRLSNYQIRFFTPLIAGQKKGRTIDVTLPMETP